MVLKATVQKQSSKQSLPKVSSKAAVRWCSSKQVFAIGKHVCWGLFLIKAWRPATLWKKFQQKCFPVNIAKFLGTAFLWELSVHYTFMWYRILWTSLGTKLTSFIFHVLLRFSFITLVLESRPESRIEIISSR